MLLIGDAAQELEKVSDGTVHTCVTSPPYYGLRDYGVDNQIGFNQSLADYISGLVNIFAQVHRTLRNDGTLWLNLGNCYAQRKMPSGLKPKDLIGVPWRVAFALQQWGWYLRSDIIWSKPNAMPESVRDRPTSAHEHIFLLSKSRTYHYDFEAIKEPCKKSYSGNKKRKIADDGERQRLNNGMGSSIPWIGDDRGKNARNVWMVASTPSGEGHWAVWPSALIKPCILAGAPLGGVVLDPFLGSGTTAQVAMNLGRQWIGCEINPAFEVMIRRNTAQQVLL